MQAGFVGRLSDGVNAFDRRERPCDLNGMKNWPVLLALPLLGACQTHSAYVTDQFKPWIGRPVRDFAVETGVVPTRVDARTYIFVDQRALGACRRSVTTDEAGLIREIVVNGC